MVALLIAIWIGWMLACAACGFARRYMMFVGVLLGGLALNMLWMVYALQAHPFEVNALMAQTAAVVYATCAFAIGAIAGRFLRAWRDSRVTGSKG